MNLMDRDFILGMTSILNEAAVAYYDGKPIVTDEQYDTRLKELKELEEETGYMLVNSPNQKNEVEVIVDKFLTAMDECNTIDRLIEFSNGEKLMASIVPEGVNVSLVYMNGILKYIETENECHFKQFKNIPYSIGKEIDFIIKGKAIVVDETKLCFYADNMIDGNVGICNSLEKAKQLGFDVVPFWNEAELNPKTIQSFVDFACDYAEDDDMPCEGIAFRFDNIDNKPLRYRGIIYKRN